MLPLDLEYAHEKLTNPKGSMLCFKGGTKIYLRKENNQRLSGVTLSSQPLILSSYFWPKFLYISRIYIFIFHGLHNSPDLLIKPLSFNLLIPYSILQSKKFKQKGKLRRDL